MNFVLLKPQSGLILLDMELAKFMKKFHLESNIYPYCLPFDLSPNITM